LSILFLLSVLGTLATEGESQCALCLCITSGLKVLSSSGLFTFSRRRRRSRLRLRTHHYYVKHLRRPLSVSLLAGLRCMLALNLLSSGWLNDDDNPCIPRSTYSRNDVESFLEGQSLFSSFLTQNQLSSLSQLDSLLTDNYRQAIELILPRRLNVALAEFNEGHIVAHDSLITDVPASVPSTFFPLFQDNGIYDSKFSGLHTPGAFRSAIPSLDMPIVIDTGASLSLTPVLDDFVGPLEPADITEIRGVTHSAKVLGWGMASWEIRDVFGVVRTITTRAYHVPDCKIRLFSPQRHFKAMNGGNLYANKDRIALHLSDGIDGADGTQLEFPYNHHNGLPLMLLNTTHDVGFAGFSRAEVEQMQTTMLMDVADSRNRNLTAPQQELMLWHCRFGHCAMSRVQSLFSQPTSKLGLSDLGRRDSFLEARCPSLSGLRGPQIPVCSACRMGKMARAAVRSKKGRPPETDPDPVKLLSSGKVRPGAKVSMDQYISGLPGRLPHTRGRELAKDRYHGGTLFVDHSSGFIFLRNQVGLTAGETLLGKRQFEQFAREYGIVIEEYHADNAPFAADAFRKDFEACGQRISFSGVGAHHQNGTAERAIKTITSWARTMMLHASLMWPDQSDLGLWPFALQHAVYLWNHLPDQHGPRLSPLELFTQTRFLDYSFLARCHVWGSPVYVLDPKLQDGKKIPKWNPRARRGVYLGQSPKHSSQVALVLNPATGHISPQYHVVFDDMFTSVANFDDPPVFDPAIWNELVKAGVEKYIDEDDPNPPELSDDWLTHDERQQRVQARVDPPFRARDSPARLVPPIPPVVSSPVTSRGPEGRIEEPLSPSPSPPFTPLRAPPDSVPTPSLVPEGAIRASEGVPIPSEGVPLPISPQRLPLVPEGVPLPSPPVNPAPPPSARPQRRIRRPRRYIEEMNWKDVPNIHRTRRVRYSQLDSAFLAKLDWSPAADLRRASSALKEMVHYLSQVTDVDTDTVEELLPMMLSARANDADTCTWSEAMAGPDSNGYWDAAQTEIATLVEKNTWTVIDRQPWMRVLRGTWAFRCKRFPDGSIRKLKGRFCVRGDDQLPGIDFFETFAPVVNWNTVRLMLLLAISERLCTTQVDYTAAFCQAPIDCDVYVEMPTGFQEPGKVLKLNQSLYGLKQSPRNFFQHLKGNLETLGFISQTDIDPCLFVGPKCIILVYVDDTLFFAREQRDIDEAIEGLRTLGMELEVEADVAGFLGVLVKRDEVSETVTLTQQGLTDRIIDALDISDLPTVQTPATREPLGQDLDGDPGSAVYSYSSVVGMLQYLQSHSRPDITFAVSQVARFVHNPKRSHELALERIGQYLKATRDKGLILKPSKHLSMDAYVDADFAGLWGYEDKQNPVSVKSRSGFVICVSNCPVIWTSKLQTDIALSTMEAEYNALSMAMRDLIPFRNTVRAVASSLGLSPDVVTSFQTTVHEDNNGALILANQEPGRMTPRSKHYGVKYHWFRSHVQDPDNNISIVRIDTTIQKADILTKGLTKETFVQIRQLLCGW
jgi:hypothetical protein